MRRAVGLLLVLITLSGCGNKSALYLPSPLPSPERDTQQNSKPVPRQ
jgi:predicted small lipoprotein YifL